MSSNDTATRPSWDPACADPRVSVVIPAYNEAANLPYVLSLLPPDVQLIVVDGRSTDGTLAVTRALRPDATIVRQDRRGKGNALTCGFAAVTGDIVVTLDADGSTDPREIPSFVDALVRGADVAKGTRFARGGASQDSTVLRTCGNRCLSIAAAVLFGTRCTDLTYTYTALWTRCLPALRLTGSDTASTTARIGDGFDFAAVLKARVAKAGLNLVEVPSVEHPRRWGESRLNVWRDGGRVLRALLVERLTPAGVQVDARKSRSAGRSAA